MEINLKQAGQQMFKVAQELDQSNDKINQLLNELEFTKNQLNESHQLASNL